MSGSRHGKHAEISLSGVPQQCAGQDPWHQRSHSGISLMSQKSTQLLHASGRFEKRLVDEGASALRVKLSRCEQHFYYQGGFIALVLINMYLIILEADASAGEGDPPEWIGRATRFLTMLYVAELIFRVGVYRAFFFATWWNLLDTAIVLIDVALLILSQRNRFLIDDLRSIAALRLFRLVKLARSYKMLILFPELHLMMRGLVGALKSVFWGVFLIGFVLVLYSIVAVYVIHPLNVDVLEKTTKYDGCDRCARAYSSVSESMLTFFQQIIAGDSWGAHCIPIIEMYPSTSIFFASLLIIYNLLLLNLILGLIMDSAIMARRGSDMEVAAEREVSYMKAQEEILVVFSELDLDNSGSLTKEEIIDGAMSTPSFKNCLAAMDIPIGEVGVLCAILDHNNSDEVDYHEFAEELYRLKDTNVNSCIVFIKHYVKEIQKKLEGECNVRLKELEQMLVLVAANVELLLQHGAPGCPFAAEGDACDDRSPVLVRQVQETVSGRTYHQGDGCNLDTTPDERGGASGEGTCKTVCDGQPAEDMACDAEPGNGTHPRVSVGSMLASPSISRRIAVL